MKAETIRNVTQQEAADKLRAVAFSVENLIDFVRAEIVMRSGDTILTFRMEAPEEVSEVQYKSPISTVPPTRAAPRPKLTADEVLAVMGKRPKSTADIGRELGTNPQSTIAVLRELASVGMVRETSGNAHKHFKWVRTTP
jgi:predicted Rossmann fold nucleotide-binding protein DprA/Smf involved in DNA uptake